MSAFRPCPFCSAQIAGTATCPSCGRDPTARRRVCARCGKQTPFAEPACIGCGVAARSEMPGKIAIIVALFAAAIVASVLLALAR